MHIKDESFNECYSLRENIPLSMGGSCTSGQKDVGHEGVATGRREFSLPSLSAFRGHDVQDVLAQTWPQDVAILVCVPLLHLPKLTTSKCRRWSQDVTDFSRPQESPYFPYAKVIIHIFIVF